ncbi:MAG: M20/M25/M40 family metallo-hydrolase [Pseudomonadota bacterium]
MKTTIHFISIIMLFSSLTLTLKAEEKLILISIGKDAYQGLIKENIMDTNIHKTILDDGEVVVTQITESDIPRMTHYIHHELKRCGGFMVHSSISEAQLAMSAFNKKASTEIKAVNYSIDNGNMVNLLHTALIEQNIVNTISSLTSFTNRYYSTISGKESAEWIKNNWDALTSSRNDIRVEFFSHSAFQQNSVIATIEGTRFPNEVIVVGGHLDSTAGFSPSETTRAPGADDDASGIATITEVLRAIAATGFKPERTIKMMGYAAEEVGLRGSQDIAQNFKQQGINVIGVLQLDMTNYKGSAEDILLLTDNTNTAQNQFLSDLAETYQNVNLDYTRCGYACSDHASWHNQGFAASMPFEARMGEHNQAIHTSSDTLAQSNNQAAHAMNFARLAASYIAELAKGTNGDDNPEPPNPPNEEITETFTGSVVRNQEQHYGPFNLEPNSHYNVQLSGDNDADLYVHFGQRPTSTLYTCRPWINGSAESCTGAASNTTMYVMVRGYSSTTSNFRVDVTYRTQTIIAKKMQKK